MLTKTGIKIRICSSTGKGTQHLEQDSKFPELLPSAPQVLDGPRRPRDRLQPLHRTCQAKFALRAEPTLSVAGDGSTTSAGMVPGQPRSRPGSGTARGGCRGALGAAKGRSERLCQSSPESVEILPFPSSPGRAGNTGQLRFSWGSDELENTDQFCIAINFDVFRRAVPFSVCTSRPNPALLSQLRCLQPRDFPARRIFSLCFDPAFV